MCLDRLAAGWRRMLLLAAVALVPTIASCFYKVHLLTEGTSDLSLVASKIPKHASLFVFDNQPIIYLLADVNPPTKFVLPGDFSTSFFDVVGVNPAIEIDQIFSKRPEYVITKPSTTVNSNDLQNSVDVNSNYTSNPAAIQQVQSWLTKDYDVVASYPDATIFMIKSDR
jgi:hypothetical protein